MEKDKKVTALYCRLSKDDGSNSESLSIRTQKSMLMEYLRPRRYRSWALFRSSVWPSRQSMFPLTATASRISAWALRYSA